MRTWTKTQLNWFQFLLLLLVVGVPPVLNTLTHYAGWVLYTQIAVLLVGILIVFYQLWKQKNGAEIKRRFFQSMLVMILVIFVAKLYYHQYVTPHLQELIP